MANIQNSIQLYKAEYLKENNFKRTIVGGQKITMQFACFGDMTCLFIRLYNEEKNQIATYSINCANTQIVEVLKTKLACTVAKKDQSKLKDLVDLPRWQFFSEDGKIPFQAKQIDLEEYIEQSKKKEGVK